MPHISIISKANAGIRLVLFICAAWLALSLSPISSPNLAIAAENQCTVQQNSCGCNTCGGGTEYRPVCPFGQTLYDDYCLPTCPDGFVRYPGLPGLCVPPVYFGCPDNYDQVPLPQCPLGFHRDLNDPDNCAQDAGYPNEIGSCPSGMGYSPQSGRCEFQCPAGTFLGEHGLCQSVYVHECPQGFNRDPESGQCIPPGVWPPNYGWVCLPHCPIGTYRDIRHPTRCIPPPPSCLEGYENISGRCLPNCEQGLSRDSYGYCVPPRCQDGSFTNLRGQCGPSTCRPGTENYHGQCVPICDDGSLRNSDGRCVPPRRNCPQGERFNIQNANCEPVPPVTNNCPQGTEYNPQTLKCEPNRQPNCLAGMVRDANGRCVPVQQPNCLAGMIRNADGVCVPPKQLNCFGGLIRDANGNCVPPHILSTCKPGTQPNADGICLPILRLVPSGCPDGMYLDRRRQRCLPLGGNNNFDQPPPANQPTQGNQPPPPLQLNGANPPINLSPSLLKLNPSNPTQGLTIVGGCPQGMVRDANGRCMKG